MQLFSASDRWTVLSTKVRTPEAALSAPAAKAVREAREQHDRNNAAALEFASFAQLVAAFKRWQSYHRSVCRVDRVDCTCNSVSSFWTDSPAFSDYVESSMPWAKPTRQEMVRRRELLVNAVRRAAHVVGARCAAAFAAPNHLTQGPGLLLISPLTSAPGAPPASCASQLSEGIRAA